MKAARVVIDVLAGRQGRPASSIHPWMSLARDLGVTPLHLVLVALDVAAIEDVELDVQDLQHVTTVADLVHLFVHATPRARQPLIELDVAS